MSDATDVKQEAKPEAKPERDPVTEARSLGVKDGHERARKQIANELGVETLDVGYLKAALEEKRKGDEASKTLSQKLAEREAALNQASSELGLLKQIVLNRHATEFAALDDSMKQVVLDGVKNDFGADPSDVIAQSRYMSTAAFQALLKASSSKTQNSQGKTPNSASNSSAAEASERDELWKKAMSGDRVASEKYIAKYGNVGLSLRR